MLKAVFFDLYGTLVDIRTHEDTPELWAYFAGYTGRPLADARALRQSYEDLTSQAKEAADAQGPDREPDFAPIFETLLGTRSPEAVAAGAWAFRRASTHMLGLYDGCLPFLDRLKELGLQRVLVSNAQSLFTRPELTLLELDKHLDAVYISSEQGFCKPSAELYRRALEGQGLQPQEVLMVGNDRRCDVLGPKALGLRSAYFRTAISPQSDPGTAPEADFSSLGADYCRLLKFIQKELSHGA